VQTGGFVWYVDAWAQSLNRIDLASGQTVQAQLPSGAAPGELVAAADGTLWVADAASHVLYRLSAGSLNSVTVPLVSSATDGPRGLSMGADGRLWYQGGGQLVAQQ
jgi:streptogramin lyase